MMTPRQLKITGKPCLRFVHGLWHCTSYPTGSSYLMLQVFHAPIKTFGTCVLEAYANWKWTALYLYPEAKPRWYERSKSKAKPSYQYIVESRVIRK